MRMRADVRPYAILRGYMHGFVAIIWTLYNPSGWLCDHFIFDFEGRQRGKISAPPAKGEIYDLSGGLGLYQYL